MLHYFFYKGRGKPINRRAQNNRTTQVPPHFVPDVATTVTSYEATGGQLTRFPSFGTDPLAGNPERQQRRDENFEAQFDVARVFGSIVNGVDAPYRSAIYRFSTISRDMVHL